MDAFERLVIENVLLDELICDFDERGKYDYGWKVLQFGVNFTEI